MAILKLIALTAFLFRSHSEAQENLFDAPDLSLMSQDPEMLIPVAAPGLPTGAAVLSAGVQPAASKSISVNQTIANTTMMNIPRKEVQYLSCGAPKFGNAIPQNMDDFKSRVQQAYKEMESKSVASNFQWDLPVSPVSPGQIRWSKFATSRGINSSTDSSMYNSGDKRSSMPAFKLSVQEDKKSAVYDVVLLAPKQMGRPNGVEIFKTGLPASAFKMAPSAPSPSPSASKVIEPPSSFVETDGPVPAIGFNASEPFIALLPAQTETALTKTKEDLVLRQIQSAQAQAEKAKEAQQVVQSTVTGVAQAVSGNSPASAVQRGVAQIGGASQTKPVESFADAVTRLSTGDVTVANVETAVTSAAKALGVPPIRRLQAVSSDLIPELSVLDTSGKVLYGPVHMHCPYLPIPKSEIKATDGTPLIFQVVFKTTSGTLVDEMDRPLKVDSFIMPNGFTSVTDNPSKCPEQVLGARLLGVNFDEFTQSDETREAVRKILADSLKVDPKTITFCDAKEGSTIIAFDAGADMSSPWGRIVRDSASPVQSVLQLDKDFKTVVPRDLSEVTTQNKAAMLRGTDSENLMELPTVRDAPEIGNSVDFSPYDTEDEIEKPMEGLPPRTATMPVTAAPHSKAVEAGSSGVPGWGWALIAIAILLTAGSVLGVAVIYLLSRRKLKNDDDIIGKPVDGTADESTFTGGDRSMPSAINRVGVSVEIRSPATNRVYRE